MRSSPCDCRKRLVYAAERRAGDRSHLHRSARRDRAAGLARRYPRPDASAVRRVGIVLAGNIPLVGFFDLLCVCICGHRCFVKPSSKDRVLTGYVVEQLLRIEPAMPVAPLEEDTPLDALIATGSDSTRSYFGKRYREMPSLLRGSRYSIAVLDGTETEAQLEGLSNDVFQYFGLGCRNVGRFLFLAVTIRRCCAMRCRAIRCRIRAT